MFSISSSNWCWLRFDVPYFTQKSVGRSAQHDKMSADLEGKMLEEVRGAICLVSLCPGAGVDPHADR